MPAKAAALKTSSERIASSCVERRHGAARGESNESGRLGIELVVERRSTDGASKSKAKFSLKLHTGVCRIHMDPSDRGVVSAAAHSVAATTMAAVEEATKNRAAQPVGRYDALALSLFPQPSRW